MNESTVTHDQRQGISQEMHDLRVLCSRFAITKQIEPWYRTLEEMASKSIPFLKDKKRLRQYYSQRLAFINARIYDRHFYGLLTDTDRINMTNERQHQRRFIFIVDLLRKTQDRLNDDMAPLLLPSDKSDPRKAVYGDQYQ